MLCPVVKGNVFPMAPRRHSYCLSYVVCTVYYRRCNTYEPEDNCHHLFEIVSRKAFFRTKSQKGVAGEVRLYKIFF